MEAIAITHPGLESVAEKEIKELINPKSTSIEDSVVIFEPKELKIPLGDAQNILVDISNIVTSLAHAVFVQEGQLRKYRSETPQDNPK